MVTNTFNHNMKNIDNYREKTTHKQTTTSLLTVKVVFWVKIRLKYLKMGETKFVFYEISSVAMRDPSCLASVIPATMKEEILLAAGNYDIFRQIENRGNKQLLSTYQRQRIRLRHFYLTVCYVHEFVNKYVASFL